MKNLKYPKETLKYFLECNLTKDVYNRLHFLLYISKKKLTIMLRKPNVIPFEHIVKFSELTGRPLEDFKQFLKENSIK